MCHACLTNMSRGAKLSAACLCVAVLLGFVFWGLRSTEPSYQGRNLTAWLEEYNRAGAVDKTGPASDAIRAIGARALPYLVARLTGRDPGWKVALLRRARQWRVHFLSPPRSEPPLVAPALLALKALGPAAAPSIPRLLEVFEDASTRRVGGLALFSVGPAAIPAFEEACGSSDGPVRAEAATFLAMLPAGYNDEQPYYCIWYRFDQWSGPQAYVAKPPYRDLDIGLAGLAKNHPNPNVRLASVEVLASRCEAVEQGQSRIALRALQKARNDPNLAVSNSAEAALRKLRREN